MLLSWQSLTHVWIGWVLSPLLYSPFTYNSATKAQLPMSSFNGIITPADRGGAFNSSQLPAGSRIITSLSMSAKLEMMVEYRVQQRTETSDHMGEAEVMVDYRVQQERDTPDNMGAG